MVQPKIRKLQYYSPRDQINIRITFISPVRHSQFGKIINFHGIDETGEIAIVNFGDFSDELLKFLKV